MAKILLLEDQPTPALLLQHVLTTSGHQVTWVSEGAKCLAMLKEARPEILITDMVMTGMDGVEVIRAIRAYDTDLPIIALSGGGRDGVFELLEAAKDVGVNEAIRKPPSDDELLAAVARYER